ncbi:SPER-like protein [Mya arenaria]|uniref:SPER-like protein n=1 Tax=Mya arenaria TaxID=6604 RepID=A0ABY7E483_MYAAR|nr:SPER-like protein [Mya arenaria]
MDLRKQILVLVLICTSALAENLRLDNITGYDYEGPVQVNVNGEWAYVSKHSIEPTTAKTICKLLGHGYVGFPVDKFIYMTGNLTSGLPMLVGILSCNGTENDISTCIKGSNNVIPRGASYVAGVHCFEHAFSEVRLMGGATPRNGLVQVRMDDRWGYMCGYNWVPSTIEDVICRTIGYTHSNGTSLPLSIDHSKNHINWLEAAGMVCDISESKLNQCAYVHRLEYQFACKEYYQTVTCHTRLGEVCTTDEHCSGVANAVCVNNLCSCKTGYLTLGEQCPVTGDFLRLRNVTEYKYEGVVLLNANGTWGHVNMHESAVGVVCRNLGYGAADLEASRVTPLPNDFERLTSNYSSVALTMSTAQALHMHTVEAPVAVAALDTKGKMVVRSVHTVLIVQTTAHVMKQTQSCAMPSLVNAYARMVGSESICVTGWQGLQCTDDINECSATRCSGAKEKCVNLPGTYKCECQDGDIYYHDGSCLKESNGRHEIPSTIRNSVQLRSSVPKSEDYFTINDNGRDRGYTDLQSKRDENRNNRLNSAKPLNESGHYDYISDKKPDHPQSLTMRKDEKGYIEFQYRPGAEYLPLEKEAKVNNDYLKVHGSNKGSNVDHPYLTPKYGQHDEGYLRPISNNRHQNTRKRDDEQDGYLRPVSNRRRNTTNLQEKPVEDGYLKANRRQER